MATLRENTNNEEFVTIVSVGNSFAENGVCDKVNNIPKAAASDVPFVTVLSIGQTAVEEEVTVYRLPGEKLGFGLKFEGGTKSAERVRRLFIQSCAAESPAGRARAGWGPLDAGDEILCIDGISVTSLTRLECVRCLKDSNVAVKLLVRHSPEGKHLVFDGNCPIKNGLDSDNNNSEIERLSLPPPVPPRKLPRRNTKDSLNCENLNGNGRVVSNFEINQSTSDSKKNDIQYKMSETLTILENGQGRKGPLGRQSPGRPRRPAPIHSAPPPEAQVYTDLFCHEKENGIHIAESESDDTGSSISTVIDRLSSYSSFPGSVENSIPSTPTLGTKQINIHVLTSIENMDEKFISDIPTRYIDDIPNKDSLKSNVKMASDKNATGDIQVPNGDVHTNSNEVVISNISITKEFTSVKLDHSVKYNNDANNNTNTIKIGSEDVVDFVPNKVTAITEIPKPLPRNLNKKNVDSHLHNDYNNKMDRPYEENLSPAKLHNIETWLQDAINMNNFENVKDHHEYDREMIKPEALPRLIDFVPKSQFGPKNQVEIINQQKEPPVATERKEKPEFNLKLTINIDKEHEILKADDLSSDWTYTGGSSPQLETIGEDDEDSPGGPTLPIIKVTQQPSIGLTNGDGNSTPEAAKSTSSDDTIFNDTPPISNKYDMPALEKTSSKTIEPEECAVNLVVSRGTRSPPDGRENPATHQENVPIFSNITNKLQDYASQKSSCQPNTKSSTNYLLKETMVESSPRILYEPSQKNNKIMPSKTYGRGKDVKSEGSVKDKIAMFSVHKTVPDTGSDKKSPTICKSTEPRLSQRFSAYNDSLSKSHESLLDSSNYYSGKSVKTQKPIADWSVNGAPNKIQEPVNGVSNKNQDFVLAKPYNNTSYEIKSLNSVEKPKETKPAPITIRNVQPISAIDSKKIDKAKTDSHKSTIDYLIEQRRKSMTKLRGLVIPDSPCISDLPEIKSRDSLKTLTSPITDKTNTLDRYTNKSKPSKPSTFLPSLWDSQSLANNVPKYSPAFKRKPLQVYGTKTSNESTPTKPMNGFNGENKGETFSTSATEKSTIPSKPLRTTLDTRRPYEQHDFSKKTSTLPSNFRGPASVANPPNYGSTPSQLSKPKRHELFSVIDTVDHSNLKILKAFSDTADSDNDSAVSSTQSSYLSTVSSPTPSLNTADNSESDCSSQSTLSRDVIAASKLAMGKTVNGHDERPFENGLNRSYLQMDDRKRNVCRSLSSDTSTSVGSSNSSTLTSGSQASCSSAGSSNPDTGSHRILKPRSIEAINRKNILASAKCRSGKDNKFGSPLIERKFSDAESTDECDANKDSKHMSNGGSMVRYHSIKNASAYTGDAVLKVAYSTLVVDETCSSLKKQGVDCTCSTTDTGSESEAEVAMPVKVEAKPKKYSNGPAPIQQDRIATSDNYTEQIRARKRVPAAKPGPVVEVGTRPTADGVESPKTTITTTTIPTKVKGSLMQEEDNEQCSEVRLSRGEGGGVGVTLAGGADCEAKEVTIHKVLQGSAAERDGRLCKGDKVVSINGQSMKGLSHAQSVAILKDPQPEVIIVIRGKRPAADVSKPSSNSVNISCDTTISVELEKADAPGGAGLGISLEGGGNKPILINKLFTGGAAARSGQIKSGSELLAAGGTKLVGLTRTEAWGLLRALPPGPVTLLLRPP